MWKNYLKISSRHLWKHKRYVLINLLGLGTAIAMCILAYLSWNFDRDFDQFHDNVDNLYRVTTIKQSDHLEYGIIPIPIASAAQENIAGVQAGIAINRRDVKVGDGKETYWEMVSFTNPNFLEWFDFPLLTGQADLTNPNHLLITEKIARKYFGTTNPIGKNLTLYSGETNQRSLTVVGVLQNPPYNSSIQFDLLTNFENQFHRGGEKVSQQDWSYLTNAAFLVLKSPKDHASVNDYLQKYVATQNLVNADWQAEKFTLRPLSDMAHHAQELRWNSMRRSLPPPMIWGTVTMAILLLLTACLNFTNTTISLAGKRLKEIGVRKVMGGTRIQLVLQLLVEGLLMSLASLAVGLLLLEWILPHYNQMWEFIDLQLTFLNHPLLIVFLVAIVLITTFLSAAYPAFYISAFSPTRIFRGTVQFAGTTWFSRILLGMQVTISMLAVVTGLSFAKNADFLQYADLGFEREGTQSILLDEEQNYQVIKRLALQSPEIESVAGAYDHIGAYSFPNVDFKFRGESQETALMSVGENYIETMDIQLIKGRMFNYDLANDYEQTVLINEKFANSYFAGEDPIGQQITVSDTTRYTIAGVMVDFVQNGFFSPIQPLMMKLVKSDGFPILVLKTSPENMLAVRDDMKRNWNENFPNQTFEHHFQNDLIANSLEVTNNVKNLLLIFALIALFLTIAGLGSLISMDILKRLKEITIRRILGAETPHIAYLIGSRFLLIVVGSLVIGGLSGLFISKTILDSIYKVHGGVHPSSTFIAASVLLFIVFLTIASRLFGVLKNNPASALKNE